MTAKPQAICQTASPKATFPKTSGRVLRRVMGVASTSRELVTGLARSGRWWLIPLVGMMGLCALLLGVVSVIEYAAPFVYSIF